MADALDTLGTIITEKEKRDAIHVAVVPAIATGILKPGDHVSYVDGKASLVGKKVGIVDPFLPKPVKTGDRCWVLLYPRTITSLRHVWTHPDFEDEVAEEESPPVVFDFTSELWLREFCDGYDTPDYETVIEAAEGGCYDEYLHFDGQDAHGDIPPEFWDHIENVTGVKVPGHRRAKYFSCSC